MNTVNPQPLDVFHLTLIVLSVALHFLILVIISLVTRGDVTKDFPKVACDQRLNVALHGHYATLRGRLHSLSFKLAQFGFDQDCGITGEVGLLGNVICRQCLQSDLPSGTCGMLSYTTSQK